MGVRLEQLHPVLVHAPIVLVPLSIGADLLGGATGSGPLLSFGRTAIRIAAAGAAASVVTGLIAGEEVNVEGPSMDMLMTHRNLNVIATVVTGGMTAWRRTHREPTLGYLATGMMGVGVLTYTAYLGGKLVYETGVGVEPAHGVYRADAPTLTLRTAGSFVKAAGTDLVHGVQHMLQEIAKGNLVPTIMAGIRKGPPAPSQAE
jgi:uncharacterized membrane protein